MESIEKNKLYKIEKKAQKQKDIINKKIQKHKLVIEAKKKLAIQKYTSSINNKLGKKLAKFKKKQQENLEKFLKNIEREKKGKKKLEYKKKDKTLARYRKYSASEFQRCIRFNAKDGNWYVKTIDWKIRHWKKCDAWHIFSKSKYSHMIFIKNNCYPQSKQSNKELWTTDWLIFKEEVIKRIWKSERNKLVKLADDKQLKNEIRNKWYWKEKYEKWHKNRKELEKNFKIINKKKWKV